jgi:DNA-binding NarL/FixJ family response regulator
MRETEVGSLRSGRQASLTELYKSATDGYSAIALAQKERPNLIILDLGLPAGKTAASGKLRWYMSQVSKRQQRSTQSKQNTKANHISKGKR